MSRAKTILSKRVLQSAALIILFGGSLIPGFPGPDTAPLLQKVDLAVESITKVKLKESVLDYSVPVPTVIMQYQVRVTIRNVGTAPSRSFDVKLERRPEPPGWGSAYEDAGILKSEGLAAGASVTLAAAGTFQDQYGGIDQKWWCFKATADPDKRNRDVNYKNNVLIQTDCKIPLKSLPKLEKKAPDVKPPPLLKPDLVVTDIRKRVIEKSTDTPKITPVTKTRYKLVVWVKNEGPGPAGLSKVKIERYPEPKHIWKSGYEDVIVLDCPGLAAGASTTLVAEGPFEDIECVYDPRWWCYKATADFDNAINETNEANNVFIQTNCKQY